MEIDSGPPAIQFSVNVLEMIKSAQNQRGARYSDYQRYRRYCSARLRRLYKSLKFLHGRGKYVRKTLEIAMVTDARFLHIPLYLSERAWSYAMELKSVDSGTHAPRRRLHLIGRMTKAARWADVLVELCSHRADPRTLLEAQAYAAFMWGNVLLEKETDWTGALEKFVRVSTVYKQLGQVGEVSHQVLCRQRVDEMEPNIRYCQYKMGRTDVSQPGLWDLDQGGPVLDLLQSKLEAVMEEARAQQAASMTELTWLGQTLTVHGTKTKLAILKGRDIEADLAVSVSSDRQLVLYDKLFVAYQEAKRQIRDDLLTAGDAEDVKEQLAHLSRVVSSILLERTIDRNLLLVQLAKARLNGQLSPAGAVKDKKGEKEKPAKPEDLVRLYDTLIQNVSDLKELVAEGRREQDNIFLSFLDVRKASFRASRCSYVASTYAASQKLPEAYLMFTKAADLAREALGNLKQLAENPQVQMETNQLEAVEKSCRAQKSLIHARVNLEQVRNQEGVRQGVSQLSLKEVPSKGEPNEVLYLLDFLDEYKSAIGLPNKLSLSTIFRLPPPLEPVPCRPIVVDTVVNTFEFPSLDERSKKETRKATQGWLGGFFSRT